MSQLGFAVCFRKVKRLAESDSDNEDSALLWVKKVRKKETEKKLAAKRAQLLEEMDEEFGVGELVENVMGNKTKVDYNNMFFSGKHPFS